MAHPRWLLALLWSLCFVPCHALASDTASPLRPTLLMEADHRVYPAAQEGLTGFALARLRPGLIATPSAWLRGVTTVELASKNLVLLDAYAQLRVQPWLDLSIGYAKPPLFASFINEPVYTLPIADRAPVVASFRIRRDLGVAAHIKPSHVPLEGWVRVGNGNGSALGNDNALPAGYAALDLVLGRAHRAAAGARDADLGLRIGLAGLYEHTADREGIAGQTPLGFKYYRPVIVSGARAVAQGHVIAYAGPLRLSMEGAFAREGRSRDTDGVLATPRQTLPSVSSYGLTAELLWTLWGPRRQVGIAPQADALELTARYDRMWLGRGADDVSPGGAQGAAVALKWWPAPAVALSGSTTLTLYDVPAIERPDSRWSWGGLVRASLFWGY